MQLKNVLIYIKPFPSVVSPFFAFFGTKEIHFHTFQMKNYFNSQDDKNNFVNSVNHCITVV